MSYLSSSELADLVGCKPNQKARMITWLASNRWRHEVDLKGMPKVARAYHDKKMGINDEKETSKLAEQPNLDAFSQRANRNRPAVQIHRRT
ncbi:MAG: DUF4224 domain-containing protein [Burkholderiaceae bacterium]|nr:DUF4224 domain-containing protein [Burkholderiaceae bacterium]